MISFAARILIVLAVLKTAQAALYVTFPIQGDSCAVSQPCQIKWRDDGKAPQVSTYGETSIELVTGNSSNLQAIQHIGAVANPSAATAITFNPNNGLSPTQQYAVRFNSKSNPASPIFSTFFSITGGSGTAKPINTNNSTLASPPPIIGNKVANVSSSASTTNTSLTSEASNSASQNAPKSAASSTVVSLPSIMVMMSFLALVKAL